jgi:hypothetical protein
MALLVMLQIEVPAPGHCEPAPSEPTDESADFEGVPIPLELPANSDTSLEFGRSRSPRTTSIFLQLPEAATTDEGTPGTETGLGQASPAGAALPAPGTTLVVEAIDFERLSGDTELRPGHGVVATAVARGNRQGVRLDVCVDPEDMPAGEYQGSIVFDDPRISAGAVPFTVRLQYEKWWVVAFGALLVSAAACGYVYSSMQQQRGQGLGEFLTTAWIGVAAGVVAAGATYFSAYWSSGSWGGEPNDWLKSAAVIFTSFTTGFLAKFAGTPPPTTGDEQRGAEQGGDGDEQAGADVASTPPAR